MGTVGELSTWNRGWWALSTSNLGTEVPGAAPEGVPNMSMKVENPDAGTARRIRRPEMEGDVLTGNSSFRSWCAACVQGRGRVERHQLDDGSKILVLSLDYCFLRARNRFGEAEVAQRGDSPVLVMHDGVTKSFWAHFIPAKGVDFPSYEKVVKSII